jgi:hypothetical protein
MLCLQLSSVGQGGSLMHLECQLRVLLAGVQHEVCSHTHTWSTLSCHLLIVLLV